MKAKHSLLRNTVVQKVCQGIRLFCLLVCCWSLAGCHLMETDYYRSYPQTTSREKAHFHSPGPFKSRSLVKQLETYYRGSHSGPIGVATFVNVDDLYNTSTFGRTYAEQVMSELAMAGFDVIELRHSDALQFLSTSGEFALSRDVGVLRRERNLGGVVVGTYSVSPDRVYVNSRLIDPSTSVVLAAGTVEMPKTYEITRMLRGGSFPQTLERIPVRHLGINQYPMFQPFPNWQQSQMWQMEEQQMMGGAPKPKFERPADMMMDESQSSMNVQ